MKPRSANKADLFVDEHHRNKINTLGDLLAEIESYIDLAALATESDVMAPRSVNPHCERLSSSAETIGRILASKWSYNLPDAVAYPLRDRMRYKQFCGLKNAIHIAEQTIEQTFENRIGEEGATELFDGVSALLLKKSFAAFGVQIINVTRLQEPKKTRSDLTKEAQQEPMLLEAVDQHRQEAQDKFTGRLRPIRIAVRVRLRYEQYKPRYQCQSRLSVPGARSLGKRHSEHESRTSNRCSRLSSRWGSSLSASSRR